MVAVRMADSFCFLVLVGFTSSGGSNQVISIKSRVLRQGIFIREVSRSFQRGEMLDIKESRMATYCTKTH